MNGREPHHYCGFLILLLSMLSFIAWAYFPPVKDTRLANLVIRKPNQSVAVTRSAQTRQDTPGIEMTLEKSESEKRK